MRQFLVVVGIAMFAATAFAIGPALTVGTPYTGTPNSSDSNVGPVRTDIDLTNPATGTGSVASVRFGWSSACAGGAKIKFFRRSGNTLTLIAERGPFNTSEDVNVTLSPAVPVQQGDLIGLARVASCGNPEAFVGGLATDGFVAYPSDVTGSVDITAGSKAGGALALSGSGPLTESITAVIPVVGTTAGTQGSSFKTSLQFLVTSSAGFNGRLVFHPAGTSSTANDAQQAFSLPAGFLTDYDDFVSQLNRSGLGTVDVITSAGSAPPVFAARVFNDGGSAGTSGLIENAVPVGEVGSSRNVLAINSVAYLLTPRDLTATRLNIGIRTLLSGAEISGVVRDNRGVTVRTFTKSYPPNFFEQKDAATFTGGAIAANQSIRITVTGGSIIIYGATTDNVTNDPAVQFAEAQ